jgi:pimeloyl-ACP methyl ester carboxylesterase
MNGDSTPQSGVLAVPGAGLYYKLRGTGPLLVILPGGDGYADALDALADNLVEQWTVLTYDRRGLSRSLIDDPTAPIELSTHGDDLFRLIEAVTGEPVLVFGTSLGALLGLEFISRCPDQVRLLVAHEPPATELLPEAEREMARRDQEEVEDLYLREGVAAAMRKFIAIAGVTFDDREPDVDIRAPKPERIANLEFFLAHDAPAVRRYRLDISALRAADQRIVPGFGQSSCGFPRRCAEALAHELGNVAGEFPGGHSGCNLRPRGFAIRLREILAERADRAEWN